MAGERLRVFCSCVLLAASVAAMEAGGWVVITVTDLPDHVVVGEPLTVTYAVRQHGMRLLSGLSGHVEARLRTAVVRADAVPLQEVGHYSATLTFPDAGNWVVEISSGFGGQLNSSRIALNAIERDRLPLAVSPEERGRQLFVAKGCITCHVHRAIDGRSTSAGPSLTGKRYRLEPLMQFLAHPPQSEPFEPGRWQMPDLKLRDREISALAAFLKAEPTVSRQPRSQ